MIGSKQGFLKSTIHISPVKDGISVHRPVCKQKYQHNLAGIGSGCYYGLINFDFFRQKY